ncbi:hypothetical protein VA249_16160 [Vibrio alfacsensis]|uniref:hypothetical protein n=1 Tax=Vibrio alfacsensis TaxID=1074311 RepID=UPI001BEFAD67|nr:hypothetical protein [Vibrio alfacsensis]BBM64970.1 hypothetical protein VA249_16160 [Vibrio alfacsensis]
MFSLIISIIAIALVAALALASIYYGGAAFQEGSSDAEASTAVNQGQQIQAAITMADINEEWHDVAPEGGAVSTLADLDEYLKEIPKLRDAAWVVGVGDRTVIAVEVINDNVCKKIEAKGNATFNAATGTLTDSVADGQPFGCITGDTLSGGDTGFTAYYKL